MKQSLVKGLSLIISRYVRLFLRKTAAWHRVSRLHYYSDIADIVSAIRELSMDRVLPGLKCDAQKDSENTNSAEISLGELFTFFDGSERHIKTLEEASTLLMLDELKTIGKDAKLQGKTKKELLRSFRDHSQKQSGIGWRSLKRTDTEESIQSEASVMSDSIEDPRSNRDTHFVHRILSSTGECVRLSSATRRLFERVHLVFYRSTEWTEKSLTTIILARISRRTFPEYIVCRSTNIFCSRDILLEFEVAIRTQFLVDDLIEGGGPVVDNLRQVQRIYEGLYPRWKVLVSEERHKEDRVYESGEGAYLRRFSPAWIYTRIIHKGLTSLARFKEHEKEHQLLAELLNQRLFHAARRGLWYQRKALLEEHYMWAILPERGLDQVSNKRHWKKVALKTCEDGLQDKECHLIFHHDLQKRITKLERSLKVAKRQQHDFGHVGLIKAVDRFVKGIRIEKSAVTSKTKRRSSDTNLTRRGGKTIWIDEREGGGECSVEAMCLSWYRDQGWKGFHSEGRIVRTLVNNKKSMIVFSANINEFGYLFYDILFTYIPNVFQTPYQTCPLDLHTDAFFPSRISLINHRLAEISNGGSDRILREVHERESERQTCVVGLDWSYDYVDLQEIISCFPGAALATICKVMAQEYQQRGGGIPDLFLWHADRKEVMFAEVKSENDRLSDTQRLWIHVLTGAGIRVEQCNAVAKEIRVVD